MKITGLILILALAVAGCVPSTVDSAIQKAAPQACSAASIIYQTYIAAELGSPTDKATVDAAWQGISQLCADPSTITAGQLLIVTAQTSVIIRTARKAKTNA